MENLCGEPPLITGYGLGVQDYDPSLAHGQTMWGHLGSIQGYRAMLAHLPQQKATLAVMTNTDADAAMAVVESLLRIVLDHAGEMPRALAPVDVEPAAQPPAGANVVDTFLKERLFCEHSAQWTVTATREDWIDISLDWVVGTSAATAEEVWPYHEHTISINGQELDDLEAYTHEVRQYTVVCPAETLDIWAKGLSIYLPPLPVGQYEIRWFSEITHGFNNGWVDYKPGNHIEIVAALTVE
jgi:hypothetical protein